MSRRDQENEDARIANEAYRARHGDEVSADYTQACSCGRKDCAGHSNPFGNYRMTEKSWGKVVDGIKAKNPEAEVSKGKIGIFGRRKFSGGGSVHPACAAEALGRPLRRKDFVDGDPLNADKWVGR